MNQDDLISPWETTGDPYNIPCPYCRHGNYYATEGIVVVANVVNMFEKPCNGCGKIIVYKAELVVQVQAKKRAVRED